MKNEEKGKKERKKKQVEMSGESETVERISEDERAKVLLTSEPLSLDALRGFVAHPNAGAISTFEGVTRRLDAHPSRYVQLFFFKKNVTNFLFLKKKISFSSNTMS